MHRRLVEEKIVRSLRLLLVMEGRALSRPVLKKSPKMLKKRKKRPKITEKRPKNEENHENARKNAVTRRI
jgi:hypothetical protein